ncbi:MAG TPA: RNA methyltransferase [Bacteroidota bacterium]|nr:RNA methyltransferase [Bacteroidota bacterium]HRT67682.1 RNA methyltransferase [Bacteroidota bacterium]
MKKLLHDEILAQRLTKDEALQAKRHPVSLMLYNIRSLYNVGSIFRTADSALLESLILCGFTPHPPRDEISKTALGADETVPWYYEKNIFDAIEKEKSKGKVIIAVELTDSSRNYDQLQINDFPLVLILGNEISGIDDPVLERCDSAIEIPMYGMKHSLNVSVAAGIVAYEAVKIWKKVNNDKN